MVHRPAVSGSARPARRQLLPRHLPHDGLTSIAFDEPGTSDFRCDMHPAQMTGTLVVE